MQYLVVAYAGTRLTMLFASGRRHYVQIVFWFFTYVWMGLAALAQVTSDRYPLSMVFSTRVVMTTSLVVLAGLLAYDVGMAVSMRRQTPPGLIAQWFSSREISVGRVVLLGLLILLATPILVKQLGGLRAQFTSRQAEFEALTRAGLISENSKAAGAIYEALATVPAFLVLYSLWVLHQERRSIGKRLSAGLFAMMMALLVVNIVVNNPISNTRVWFGTVAISLVVVGGFAGRPRGVRWLIVGLLFSGIIVFPYADYFRYTDTRYRSIAGIETLVTKGDYDAVQMTQASVDYSERVGHAKGGQIVGALLFWYPRSWWPTKPNDTGIVLGRYYGSANWNLSCPLWGELYLDFGLPGVLLVFLGLGWFSGRADRALATGSGLAGSKGLLRVGVPVMAGYQVIIVRGSLLQSLGRAAVIGLVVLLLTHTPISARD